MIKRFTLILVVFLVAACAAKTSDIIECQEPRPEMCAMQYDPVCATVDEGVRCVTTPCDTTTIKTYGNSCSACSDPTVIGYQAGACDFSE